MIYYTIISTARTPSPLVSSVRRLYRGLRPTALVGGVRRLLLGEPSANTPNPLARTFAPPPTSLRFRTKACSACTYPPRANRRGSEAGEPTGAREHVCGPGVILTAGVKGAREGARVKIMLVGRPQTAGRASRSGAGLAIGRRDDSHKTHYAVDENKVAKMGCQKRRMGVLNWV